MPEWQNETSIVYPLRRVGQHAGINTLSKIFLGWVNMQEWWVNMNRNGGSTWSGIYTYNINDTIWLTFTTTDKTLFDTLSNQRLPTNGIKFNFRAILLPIHNTPINISNSFCKFIVPNNVIPFYDTTQFNSMINFDVGCDAQAFYNIKLGLVLKYSGTYILNLSDVGTKLEPCGNQTNPYPSSDLRFTYNLADCNKDVFLAIPPSERPEFPTGFRQAQIDAKISFAFKVQ